MCFSENEINLFAKELLRKPSKAEAYKATFPERCKGLDAAAIGKRAWKLAQKGEVRAKVRKFASVHEEERAEAERGAIVELDEFRASLSELFRRAVANKNVSDAVKSGGLLARCSGWETPREGGGDERRFDISEEELDAILAG